MSDIPTRPARRLAEVVVVIGCLSLCGYVALDLNSERVAAPLLDPAAAWKTDSTWHDGKAEYAVYRAHRTIYGKSRAYSAIIITNTQHMDPATTTKASDWTKPGTIPVFKHNVSEGIPTENYEYRFLTTAFVRTDNLVPYKIVMSSQEDCGSTYKQFVNTGGRLEGEQFAYFPDEGHSRTRTTLQGDHYFHDTLTLVLRSYPFEKPHEGAVSIGLIGDLTNTHASDMTLLDASVRYLGREVLELPIGPTAAHHLVVEAGGGAPNPAAVRSDYWFAVDSGPERLNVLVRYEGPFGVSYELESLKRWAYWERP